MDEPSSMSAIKNKLDKLVAYLKHDQDNIALINDIIGLHIKLGQYNEAQELAYGFLTRFPSEPSLLFIASNIALSLNSPKDAEILLERLTCLGVDNLAVKYNKAYCQFINGDYKSCHVNLKKMVGDWEEYPLLLLTLARTSHHLGEYEEAASYAKKYISHQAGSAEAHGILSIISLDIGDLSEAAVHANLALKININNHEANLVLGTIHLYSNDVDVAHKFLENTVAIYPSSGRAWSMLGQAELLKLNVEKALWHLKKSVELMPNHIGTWLALAWCQILNNDVDGAKASLESALLINRNFSETYGGLAIVGLMKNDKATAESHIKRAMKLDSNSISGKYAQSIMLKTSGDDKNAELIVEKLIRAAPQTVGINIKLLINKFLKNRVDSHF